MSVKVTLEFESVDLAIVALDKLVGTVPLKRAEARASSAPAAVPATRTRKGRSDAGQARGPYKESNAGAVAQAGGNGDGIAPSTVPLVQANGGQAPADKSPVTDLGNAQSTSATQTSTVGDPVAAAVPAPSVKIELVQAAIQKLYDAKGMVPAREVLSRYGVNAVRDAKAEHYALIIADCERVTAGGAP